MKNIAIVGSDSFIASQFYNSINKGKKIKLFARKSSGKQHEIIVRDLFEISSKDFSGCDVVINFTAIVHQPKLKDIALYKKINKELPIYLVGLAKKAGVRHFIQMSTIAVYGNVNIINVNISESPVTIYGKSKLAADNILIALSNENIKVSIVRPPMVYGGGNSPGNMMKLIRLVRKGIPMPFRDINNSRDFIHVKNLVQALHLIIENHIKGIVIPTDKRPVSSKEIINLICKYSSVPIRQFKLPKFIHIIINKLFPLYYDKLFGTLKVCCNLSDKMYQPQYGIEDGVKDMLQFLNR